MGNIDRIEAYIGIKVSAVAASQLTVGIKIQNWYEPLGLDNTVINSMEISFDINMQTAIPTKMCAAVKFRWKTFCFDFAVT